MGLYLPAPSVSTLLLRDKEDSCLTRSDKDGWWNLPQVSGAFQMFADDEFICNINLPETLTTSNQVVCSDAVLAREVSDLRPIGVTDVFYTTDRQIAMVSSLENIVTEVPLVVAWLHEGTLFNLSVDTVRAKPPKYRIRYSCGMYITSDLPRGNWELVVLTLTGKVLVKASFVLMERKRTQYGQAALTQTRTSLDRLL